MKNICLIFMKSLKAVAMTATFGIWAPLWLLRHTSRALCLLFVAGVISGCASNSGAFEKSPCACEFSPINMTIDGRSNG